MFYDFVLDIDKRINIQNKIISKYETLIKGLCNLLFARIQAERVPLKTIAGIVKGQQINGLSLSKFGEY